MTDILIYTTAACAYCVAAKNLLQARGYVYREVRVDLDAEARQTMVRKSKRTTVPQIFVHETHVGGFDELRALDRSGGLLTLLEQSS
jgi:glutaredoxin 3